MVDDNDSAFVRQTLGGDLHAFEILFERYQKQIFNTIARIVGDYDDATDVTQNTFIKAYQNLKRYDEKFKFFSWLYRIAVNESLNFLKSRRRDEEADETLRTDDRQPDELVLDSERDRRVRDGLGRLTEDQRTVVVLFHFQDLCYEEIAQVIGIPVTTVKSRLFEARTSLRKILATVKAE